jgi:hypothetical protein
MSSLVLAQNKPESAGVGNNNNRAPATSSSSNNKPLWLPPILKDGECELIGD